MRPARTGASAPAVRRAHLGVLPGVVVLAAVMLAGCSTSGSSAGSHTPTTRRHPPKRTTTTVPPTTAPTTAPSAPTTVPAVATCQPNQLHMTAQQGTGAAGTISMTVLMTNASSSPCTMSGYPGMQLLDAHGSALPTTVVRGQAEFPSPTANQPPSPVSLAPGASAQFALQYEDVPVGGETSCPTSAQAEVTPPNDVAFGVIALSVAPCNHGTVHVSPVYPA